MNIKQHMINLIEGIGKEYTPGLKVNLILSEVMSDMGGIKFADFKEIIEIMVAKIRLIDPELECFVYKNAMKAGGLISEIEERNEYMEYCMKKISGLSLWSPVMYIIEKKRIINRISQYDKAKAIDYYKEMIEECELLNLVSKVPGILASLAVYYMDEGRIDKSREYIEKIETMDIFHRKQILSLAYIYETMSRYYGEKGEEAKEKYYREESQKIM